MMIGGDEWTFLRSRGWMVLLTVSFLAFCKNVVAFQLSQSVRSTPRRQQPLHALQGPTCAATDFTIADLVLPEDPVQHFFFADPDLAFDQCSVEVHHEPTPPTELPSMDLLVRHGLVGYEPNPPTCPPPASVVERSAWGLPQNNTGSFDSGTAHSPLALAEASPTRFVGDLETSPPLDPLPPSQSTLSFRTIVRQLRTMFSTRPQQQKKTPLVAEIPSADKDRLARKEKIVPPESKTLALMLASDQQELPWKPMLPLSMQPPKDPLSAKSREPPAALAMPLPSALMKVLHKETSISEPPLLIPAATNGTLKSSSWADKSIGEPRPLSSVPPLVNLLHKEAKEPPKVPLVLPSSQMDNLLPVEAVTSFLEPHPPRSRPPLNHLLARIESSEAVEAFIQTPVLAVLLEPEPASVLEPRPLLQHLLVHSKAEELSSGVPIAAVLLDTEEHQQNTPPPRSKELVQTCLSETSQSHGGEIIEQPLQTIDSSSANLPHATAQAPVDPVHELAFETCKASQSSQGTAEEEGSLDPTLSASPGSATTENNEPSRPEAPIVGDLEPGDPGVPPPPSTTTTLEADNNGHHNDRRSEFISFKAQRNVPCQTVIGAMLAGYVCATAATHDTSAFGPAAVAGFVSLTRGTVGDTTRVVGDWFWSVIRLSFATVLPATDVVRTATQATCETIQAATEVAFAGYTLAVMLQEQQIARGAAIQKERKVRKLLEAQLRQRKRDRLSSIDEASAQNQKGSREQRMRFRFGVSADERRREENQAKENLMSETRRDIMVYRFRLESQQRIKNTAAREASLVKRRQDRMAYRFELESSARSRELMAREANEQEARECTLFHAHRKRMEYRFELESGARKEQAKRRQPEIENVRNNAMYNIHRHIMAYRFRLESQQRKKDTAAREASLVKRRQDRMAYRFELESTARRRKLVARGANEQEAREFTLFDAHRKRMEYRFELESGARKEQATRMQLEIQNVRNNVMYNMHRHMQSYRFYLEAKARREKLKPQEQSFVRSHRNLMIYRLQLEARLRSQEPEYPHTHSSDTQSGLLSSQIQDDDTTFVGEVYEQKDKIPIAFLTETIPTEEVFISDKRQETTKADGVVGWKEEQNSDDDTTVTVKDGTHRRLKTKRKDVSAYGADEFQEANDDVGDLEVVGPETTLTGEILASNTYQEIRDDKIRALKNQEQKLGANDVSAVDDPICDTQSRFDTTNDDAFADFGEIQEEIGAVDDVAVLSFSGSENMTKGEIPTPDEYEKNATFTAGADLERKSNTSTISDNLNDDTQYVFETTKLNSKDGIHLKDSIVVSSSSDYSVGQEIGGDKVKNVSRANETDSSVSNVAAEEEGSLLVDFLLPKTGSIGQNEQQKAQNSDLIGTETGFGPISSPSQEDIKRRELRDLMRRILKSNKKSVDRQREPQLPSSEARSYQTSLLSTAGSKNNGELAASMKNFVSPGSLPKAQGRTLNDQSDLSELEILQKAIEDRHLERARTPYARRARRLRTYLKETPLHPSTPLVQLVALHLISASAPLFTMINYRNGRKPYL